MTRTELLATIKDAMFNGDVVICTEDGIMKHTLDADITPDGTVIIFESETVAHDINTSEL